MSSRPVTTLQARCGRTARYEFSCLRPILCADPRFNQYPIRLVLNGSASKEIEWHCKHYVGRGLMKRFDSGAALAKEIGCSEATLAKTFADYTQGAKTKNDPFGKKFFHHADFKMDDFFHVAIMTPVLHYTMGGLEIDPESRVLNSSGHAPIPGLFAAGEVAGGVHGANRLGGSSLLGCVVFGRVAGDSAAAYLLQTSAGAADKAKGRLGAVAGHLGAPLSTTITISPEQGKVDLSFSWAASSGAPSTSASSTSSITSTTSAPAPSAASSSPEKTQEKKEEKVEKKEEKGGSYTVADVGKHNKKDDCWVIVDGQVLDVTKFLPDHPGGEKAILLYAGRDATEEFNMLHDPKVIPRYAPDAVIGTLKK